MQGIRMTPLTRATMGHIDSIEKQLIALNSVIMALFECLSQCGI
jgi:hypothetical protein